PEELKTISNKAAPLWEAYNPASRPGEKNVIQIFLLGLKVGNLYVDHMPRAKMGGEEWVEHYKVRFQTDDFYSNFYKIDDVLESFVGTEDHLPRRYSLIQRESGQSVDDLQLFDFEKLKTFHWY